MEEQWYVDRVRLRQLRQAQPGLSHQELATRLKRSVSWVKKWDKRLDEAAPADETVLRSHSRARHQPPERISPAAIERVLEIRDEPPGGLQRTPGPVAILYYLGQDEALQASGERVPRSSSTIWRILNENQRIDRPGQRQRQPVERPAPMQHWQMDFKDVGVRTAELTAKKQHQIETLNIIDVGTSILVDNQARTDYNAETTIHSLVKTFRQNGLPDRLTFDHDPRFLGSPSGRDFPAALVRFLTCLNIEVDVSPPHNPEHNGFAERVNRTYKYEGIAAYRPETEEQVLAMNADFRYHYNYQRPNQAITCHNQPPRLAFPDLPPRPTLPETVDPDRWLTGLDGLCFTRRIAASGTVKVDKHRYYLSRAQRGQLVVLQVQAATRQFLVELAGQPFKTLPIKGLLGHAMAFDDYLTLIAAQAMSDWRRYLARARRVLSVTM